jgi:microcystin-dependent protein
MPYIVPNATDIGSLYNDLNQAEPDALDFQILGDRSTGILIGCDVVATPVASTSVSVSEGFVALKGVVYRLQKDGAPIIASSIVALPSIISNNKRFDLVVGRLTNGSMEVTMLEGPESENNPTFPASPSRLATIPAIPTRYFNPETDVVLSAVYRVGGNNTTNAHIVDKRVNVLSTTMIRGAAVPSNTFGNDGDFYYRTGVGPTASGLYVKRDGVWIELILADNFAGINPVGAIIAWPSATDPDTNYWKECNGQTLSKTAYPVLYPLIGNTYGEETATNFVLPDLRNKFLRGSSTVGTTGGSDTITLSVSNIPAHNHSLNDHVHYIGGHTHELNAQSAVVATSEAGDHTHFGDESGNENVVRLATSPLGNYVAPYSSHTAGYADGMHYNYGGGGRLGGSVTSRGGITIAAKARTSVAGRHNHTVTLNLNGVIEPSFAGFTGPSLQSNTAETGNGSPFSNIPAYANMRWFIRVK